MKSEVHMKMQPGNPEPGSGPGSGSGIGGPSLLLLARLPPSVIVELFFKLIRMSKSDNKHIGQ